MPQPETAIEEIKGRIETLGSQATYARKQAKEFADYSAAETANAERIEQKRREYIGLLEQVTRSIKVHIENPGDPVEVAKAASARLSL